MPDTTQAQSCPSARGIWEFSPRRIGWLIRNRIFHDLVSLVMIIAMILAVNLIGMLFQPHQAFFNHLQGIPWGVSILGACCILSASAFRDMQSGKSETDWVLLPATPLEKYLAALIEMAILIPIAAMTLATVCSGLLAWMENLVGGQGGRVWTFLDFSGRSGWGFFVVLTSFMLAGATVFRKQVLLKSLGVFIAYQLVFMILSTVLYERISRQNVYPGGRSISYSIAMGNSNISNTAAPDWLLNIYINYFNIHFFIITPLCALVFAYFRVREKEAKDAVQ